MDHPFDERYIDGLRDRNSDIEAHFVAYFKTPVWNVARRRLRSLDMTEDAVQETLLRVLRYFRSGKRMEFPERLPAFVLSTCRYVTSEMLVKLTNNPQVSPTADPVDPRPDAEVMAVSKDSQRIVREVLGKLTVKDRDLLHGVLDGADNEELCSRFGVSPDYLRVLLYRARQRFRAAYQQSGYE